MRSLYRIVPDDMGHRLELNFAPHTVIKRSADKQVLRELWQGMENEIHMLDDDDLIPAAEMYDRISA